MKRKRETKKEVVKRYKPKFSEGLSSYQVNKRLEKNLINKAKVKLSYSYWKIIRKNVFTFFNILLLVIGIILIATNNWSSCIFLIILILNLGIGLFQDIRAKRAVDKLSLIEKDKTVVIRNGEKKEIYSDELVLDDVILCTKGSKIPCDCIILNGEGSLNESLITGESLPLKKTVNDTILSGTYVVSGNFYARVDKIGEDNYIYKLQYKSKEFKEPKSRMFLQLNRLFRFIGVIVIVIGFLQLIEFGLLTIFNEEFDLETLWEWLPPLISRLSGSLVSMIPSGMYLLTSTALAVGVFSLTKEKVLISDMYSQETLARVDTLCIDKTGTITDGKMSVFKYKIIDKDLTSDRFDALIASYCQKLGEDNETSKALLNYFKSKKIFKVNNYIPFSSVYKYSAAEIDENGTLVIGAFDFFNLTNKAEVEEIVNEASEAGLRVITVALSPSKIENNLIPKDLKCIALIYLQDHIREDVKNTIKWFNNNSVDIKVISGDNPLTASLIAKEVGIENWDKFCSLSGKNDTEIKSLTKKNSIFGRVSPEQKEMIIQSLREDGRTIAMVGDGINDILSLKSADVSIALESGSKATKDIASVVLLDNNFNKLPKIVDQGRRVINNLERTCSLFLTKTVFAVFLNCFFLIYALITQFGSTSALLWPFYPNNFYTWELVTIGISSFLLALEPNSSLIKGNFLSNIIKKALPHGLIMGVTIMILYIIAFTTRYEHFDRIELLNISTIFISVGSFIPLFDVSRKFDNYRRFVFCLAIVLVTAVYLWSIFGFNWLMINGMNSPAPRFISLDELLIIFICLCFYFIVYLSYRLIDKYLIKKSTIKLWKE